ncbi:hypothetical protein GWI33_008429 [Rhynchophorus ferrugineus]|uniref:Uncharacterized protein n=1 Tax=Rhynchophorus ferrugineus TaxID=354439 RepID=A0A834IG52_RHYFE|nr:hypothetical protein GWI33_008429 [Rhynchophorus ferrugineus]
MTQLLKTYHLSGKKNKGRLSIFYSKLLNELYTDASSKGIGTILLQKYGDNLMPVMYYTTATTELRTIKDRLNQKNVGKELNNIYVKKNHRLYCRTVDGQKKLVTPRSARFFS